MTYETSIEDKLWELAGISGFDESIGTVDELGWFARFDKEKTILTQDYLGFQSMETFDTIAEMRAEWERIVTMYADFDRVDEVDSNL